MILTYGDHVTIGYMEKVTAGLMTDDMDGDSRTPSLLILIKSKFEGSPAYQKHIISLGTHIFVEVIFNCI